MKKTILATAITALFAASAQAATVYDKDGVTVELYGDTEVVFMDGLDEAGSEIDIQDTDFGFTLGATQGDYTLGTTLAFAAGGGTASVDEAYVSASHAKWGTLSVGKQYTVYDNAGIGNDYQFGVGAYYDQDDAGDQVVKYSIDMESFYGDIAWIKNTNSGNDAGADGFDARVGARFGGFDVVVYFADVTGADDVDYSNVNLEATYAFDAFTVGAAYTMNEAGDVDTDAITVIGVYQFTEKVQFAGGVTSVDGDADDYLQYYVNTSYAFNDNINTYFELGNSDADDAEFGYAAGMQVSF